MAEFDAGAATQRGLQMTAAGAAIGSAVPVIGTAVGAGAGALLGLGLGIYDYWRSKGDDPEEAARKAHQFDSSFVATPQILARTDFSQAMNDAQAQQAMAFGQAQQVQGRQVGLADALQAQAEGRGGPSIAEMQLRQSTDRTGAQAAGLIAAQRGINPGLAARLGAQAQAGASQQAAGQAAILRAQEQQAARAQLAQVLSGARGQSLEQQGASTSLYGIGAQGTVAQRGQDMQAQADAQRLNAATAAGNADRAAGVQRSTDANAAAAQARSDAQTQTTFRGGMAAAQAVGRNLDVPLERFSRGGRVPGRAPVHGDSPRNDRIAIMASPGEVVLPRSIMEHPNAPDAAAAFVEALLRARPRRHAMAGGR